MKSTRSFFDTHTHHHAYRKEPDFYIPVARIIKQIHSSNKLKVLDVGCGDGSFIRGMIGSNVNAEYVGTDISTSMTNLSRDNLKGLAVDLLVADGFKIPLKKDIKFDVIHIDSVLHHLISHTVSSSTLLAKDFLSHLKERLNEDGILIVEEMYYNSYLISHFTSSLIFYALKFLNYFRIDLSKLNNEIILGLEVNFFNEKQLCNVLGKYGQVKTIRKSPACLSRYKGLLLLKEWGHVTLFVQV